MKTSLCHPFSGSLHRQLLPGLTAALLVGGGLGMTAAELPQLPPLRTVSGSPHLPEKFVGADRVTDAVAAASRFHGGLFGWAFRDDGGYLIANPEGTLFGVIRSLATTVKESFGAPCPRLTVPQGGVVGKSTGPSQPKCHPKKPDLLTFHPAQPGSGDGNQRET